MHKEKSIYIMKDKYVLEEVAWEVTMGCNLRCEHCGSACTTGMPDELTTEESLALIDEVMKLRPVVFVLAGGEPFMRKDWEILVKRISSYDVKLRIITNGTLITPYVVEKLVESNINIIGVSIDGNCELHNRMRNRNCYQQCIDVLQILNEAGISTAVNTTIVEQNLSSLPQLYEDLQKVGAMSWQLQLGVSSGRLAEHKGWMLPPDEIEKIVDFSYQTNMEEGYPRVFLADTIGYYSKKEILSRQMAYQCKEFPVWDGCNAGINSLGIRHNGDIVGCLSIRDSQFTEGNIRARSVVDIWNDSNSFAWRRHFSLDKMTGFCKTCIYAEKCLGGCTNMRLCTKGSIYQSNDYCMYKINVEM